MPELHRKPKPHYLFGGTKKWNPSRSWTRTDDSLRGGSSHSSLTTSRRDKHPSIAKFSGCLDLQTLGGAGFASQRTADEDAKWDLSGYEGVRVEVVKRARDEEENDDDGDDGSDGESEDHDSERTSDTEEKDPEKSFRGSSISSSSKPKKKGEKQKQKPNKTDKLFTLILKDTTSEPNGRGYQKSTLSHEYSFRPSPASSKTATANTARAAGTETETETLDIPFRSLTPTYRGRVVGPSDPKFRTLDPSNVRGFSLMIRGFFGEVEGQEGRFELGVASLAAYEKAEDGDRRMVEGGGEGAWTGEAGSEKGKEEPGRGTGQNFLSRMLLSCCGKPRRNRKAPVN